MKCNYNGCSSKCKGDIDVDSCNVLRAYNQGAKEFAEWADDKGYFDDYHAPFLSELLSEWQKGY